MPANEHVTEVCAEAATNLCVKVLYGSTVTIVFCVCVLQIV